ncbi:MAG: hypothetical protein N2747_01515 [Chitinophagaceae bacterium]|nr:hypothetical protein [Chitinophagaceae bacterium]
MNLEFRNLLDPAFSSEARVWVYQSNRLLTLPEMFQMEEQLKHFTANWHSHGRPVRSAFYIFFGHFIILMADTRITEVSGCSTDSSVRFIRDLENQFSVSLMNRSLLAFYRNDKIEILPISQLPYAIQNGFIREDTLYFNNLVQNKKELEEQWIIPVRESWLFKKYFSPVNL